MSNEVALAEAASGPDPAAGLRAARALRDLADRLEALQVQNARSRGWSWQEIAIFLGVSKQAVHKKHKRPGRTRSPGGAAVSRKRADGMLTMFEQFEPSARWALADARVEARRAGQDRISSEHVLLGLLAQPGPAADALVGVEPHAS